MHPDILKLHADIEQDHWWFVARRRIVGDLLRVVHPAKGARLLDLGCGTGGNLHNLADQYTCIGVELDQEAVEFATSNHPRCRFTQGSIYAPETWGLREPVDVCLLMDVLEHLADDRTAMRNAAEVLRPGGHLLITVPSDPNLWSRHDVHHEHRRRYTMDSLAALLEDLPLERRLLSPFNAHLYPIVAASRWLQNRIAQLGRRGTTGDLSMPFVGLNWILERIFASERSRLRRAMDRPDDGFRRGVSLIALYRKLDDGR